MTPATGGQDGQADNTQLADSSEPGNDRRGEHSGREAVLALRRSSSSEKREMLFEAWSGPADTVSFTQVALAARQLRTTSTETHLQFTAEAMLAVLEDFDTPENQRLDKARFRRFVDQLTEALEKPSNIVLEFLMLGAVEVRPASRAASGRLQEERDQTARQTQYIAALTEDPRVGRLFALFNKSGSGKMSFSEVCHMLHRLRRGTSLQEARAQAVGTMMLCDNESKRALGRAEFTRFLQKLAVLLHMDAAALAEALLHVIGDEGQPLSLDDSATAKSMESRDAAAQVYETLSDRKLHLLFELWDKDGDGLINFAELALGLRKFSPTDEPVTEVAADAAEAMLLFNIDMDQKLDRAEFAHFIHNLCEACGTDFSTLSEFLILLAALDDNPSEELAFLLSEDKVECAVSELSLAWREGVEPAAADLAQASDPGEISASAATAVGSGSSSASKGSSKEQT